MNIEYLPLTRLVKAVKDGLPVDKLEEHFHCTIFGASIKMVFDGDYVIKAIGAYADTFYDRWTELSRDYRQDVQIKRFCEYVNWHLWNISDAYGRNEEY